MPAAALGDGDPASDVLLVQNVFKPYDPPLGGDLYKALDGQLKAAAKAGYPLKVALIASPVDLGAVPTLFDKPEQYAAFLGREIQQNKTQPLLVVMPAGFGTFKAGPSAPTAVKGLEVGGKTSDDLARAAMRAVGKLSAAAGHAVPVPKVAAGGGGGGGGGGTSALVFVVPIVLLVLFGGFAAARRAAAPEPAAETDGDARS
jgi:hypothetical protein